MALTLGITRIFPAGHSFWFAVEDTVSCQATHKQCVGLKQIVSKQFKSIWHLWSSGITEIMRKVRSILRKEHSCRFILQNCAMHSHILSILNTQIHYLKSFKPERLYIR